MCRSWPTPHTTPFFLSQMELEHNVHMDALKKQLDQERETSSVIVDKILSDTWAQPNGQPVKYEVNNIHKLNHYRFSYVRTDTWAQPNGQPVKYEVLKQNCTREL